MKIIMAFSALTLNKLRCTTKIIKKLNLILSQSKFASSNFVDLFGQSIANLTTNLFIKFCLYL